MSGIQSIPYTIRFVHRIGSCPSHHSLNDVIPLSMTFNVHGHISNTTISEIAPLVVAMVRTQVVNGRLRNSRVFGSGQSKNEDDTVDMIFGDLRTWATAGAFGGQLVVPLRPEDVRKRGLEEHITQLRADEDADAGGQPRAEVLYQAQLRGGKEVEHPRHHHSSPDRRPASLAVPVIDDQPVQRTGSARQRGSSRCQPTPSSMARRARPSVCRTELSGCRTTAGFARSRPAVWSST
ncbi:hypothetical protein TRIUR3_17936 [Triticum urartu]|uniref:Uncharacterized protein n=1 Tax=Triticum urartu TaxID=4572 RepID=M8AMY7_TRIUA|nr:hypothetical protein TRIUR3_17936 [Triticum urartu]